MQNLTENDLLLKVVMLELKMEQSEKNSEKSSSEMVNNISECHRKIEELKCKICELQANNKASTIQKLNEELNELEEQVDIIRHELPEIRLIRQIVLGLVAVILTSFAGFIFDKVLKQNETQRIENPVKKIMEEYAGNSKNEK